MSEYEFKSVAGTGRRIGIIKSPGSDRFFTIRAKGLKIDNGDVVVTLDKDDAIPFARAVLETAGVDAEIVTDIPKVTKHDDQLGIYYFDDGEPLATDLSSVEEAAQEVGYAVAVMRYHRSQPNPEVEKLGSTRHLGGTMSHSCGVTLDHDQAT